MLRLPRFGMMLAAALLASASTPARSAYVASVTPTVSQDAGTGLYTYSYNVADDASSTLPVSAFFLDVAPTADLTSILAPTGFDIFYNPGDPDISFQSADASTDIAPGGFGIFSFQSILGPGGSQAYTLRGFDADGTPTDTPLGLVTISPVPEPSTLVLLGLGAIGLFGYSRGRRGRLA